MDRAWLTCADVPYELTPDFLEELFTKHRIDYVVHGDDPCLLPDGTDAYAHAKEMGRFKMVSSSAFSDSCCCCRCCQCCDVCRRGIVSIPGVHISTAAVV